MSFIHKILEGCLAGDKSKNYNNSLWVMRSLFSLQRLTPFGEKGFGPYELDRISSNLALVMAIMKDDQVYPWGLMMQSIFHHIRRENEEALRKINQAIDLGLDNILGYLSCFFIKLSLNDFKGAEIAFTNAKRKAGADKEASIYLEQINNMNLLSIKKSPKEILLFHTRYFNASSKFYSKDYNDILYDKSMEDGVNSYKNMSFDGYDDFNLEELVENSPAYFAIKGLDHFKRVKEIPDLNREKPIDRLELVNIALDKNPNYMWGYLARSQVYYDNKAFDKALIDINTAISLGLRNEYIFQRRAKINLKLNNLKVGLKDINHSLRYFRCEDMLAEHYQTQILLLTELGDKSFSSLIERPSETDTSTKATKYYVVWIGRNTGIYESWADCETQVKGFKGNRYKSFLSLEQANEAFKKGPYQ